MYLAVVLMAAAAGASVRAELPWVGRVLLAVNEEAAAPQGNADAAPETQDARIEHQPLSRTPRGHGVFIRARVADPSHLFAPLVFARKTGAHRYEAFTMKDKGKRGFRAYLPPSILSEGSFEYFIEAQHEAGGATRLGSPRKPFPVAAFDPPPVPVRFTFRTAEPGASVRIDDQDAGRTPVTVRLLPGAHTVAVTAADGRSAERQIDVTPEKSTREMLIDFRGEAGGPASLTVQSEPSGANVLVDGAVLGRTPWSGEMESGEHTVAVELVGRMREERKLIAREGRDATLQFALAPLPKQPALAVESDPVGALVILDGKERGRTPFLAPLDKGRHQVVLSLPGRREVASDFAMPADRDLSIRLDLPVARPGAPSRLTVSSLPSGARVLIDGKEVGFTPWSGEFKPGNRRVYTAAQAFVPEERLVQVQPDRDLDVNFPLRREPGPARLHVETEPPEAAIAVDGKQVGTTPFTTDVPSGDHELQLAVPGYKTVAQQISPDAGQQLSLKLALQKVVEGQVPPLIAVASDPAGAQLYVDGRLVGATPVKARSTPGPHEIKLALDGYVTRTGKINLPDARDFELRMAISLKPVRGVEEKQEAPSNRELARAQIASAHACSKAGDYACAVKGYQKAYEYDPNPILLFNLAQMRRKMGNYAEAQRGYQAFLKDAPAGQKSVKDEARKQLAFCEAKLRTPEAAGVALAANAADAASPAAAAPLPLPQEEEDTEPPVLTHEAIKKAVRGQPVRLLARIADERSGVATPTACWRNLYRKDFECQRMGKVSEDEYGIEVPAKVVNDGFAYYLEAYDNDDNGPARSGAPELPHAVAVEDAPLPRLSAAVLAAAMEGQGAVKPAPEGALPGAGANFADPHGAATPQKQQPSSHVLRWVMLGSAAAAAGTSVGLHFHANSLVSNLSDPTYPDKAGLQNQINTEQSVSNILIGVTLAFAVGAVGFWNF